MATNASGREYQLVFGIQDVSELAIGGDGNLALTDFIGDTPYFMRVAQVNGINYDGAFTNAEVLRSGRRSLEDGDFIQHYGSGSWTYDFDYLVENEVLLQALLSLATDIAATSGTVTVTPAVANTTNDYSHGSQTADNVGIILLVAPPTTSGLSGDDQIMHSAVLQNLTLSMDMGTDAGRLHASGQFYSGYKPIIKDAGVTGTTTAVNYEKGLFDFTTLTLGGHSMTVTAFSCTISNPANRVGWQGTSAEADGYNRAGLYDISGSITVKYEENSADALADWKAGTAYAIALNDGNNWSFSIPNARMTGHNIDFADEGMFVEIPWRATAGTDGDANLAVFKMT